MRGPDEDDFTAFVIARQRALQRAAWLLTGDWSAAEDLVAQVLAKMWLNWPRIRRRDDPHVYACRVLVNTQATSRRRRWWGEIPHAEPPEEAPASDAMAADVVLRRAVIDALARLPRRHRQVVVLRYFEDLSESETAAAMGVAVGTVKATTRAAVARLRADPRLGLHTHDEPPNGRAAAAPAGNRGDT
jgi:RNA polymerase sigma-70 factor (sigma-E family)